MLGLNINVRKGTKNYANPLRIQQKILKTNLRSFSLIRLQFINLMNDFPSIFSKLFKQLVGWCNKLYKIGSSRILNENLIKKNQRKIAS